MTTIKSRFINNSFESEYFFTTDHCQPNLSDDWVSVSYTTMGRAQVKALNDRSGTEILNPNPEYQA